MYKFIDFNAGLMGYTYTRNQHFLTRINANAETGMGKHFVPFLLTSNSTNAFEHASRGGVSIFILNIDEELSYLLLDKWKIVK